MEEFALAPDRAKVLERLIPGTEEHAYHQCLHLQNEGKIAEAEKVLAAWVQRHGQTALAEEMRNRQALLGYSKDPKKSLERIRAELGLSFHHEREDEDEKPSYPTKLDPKEVSDAAFREDAFAESGSHDVNGFKARALESLLDEDDLDPERRRDLLSKIQRPDHPRLVERIVQDLKQKHSGGFGSHAVHRLLLEAQLDELAKLHPAVTDDTGWTHEKVKRLRPGPDVAWEEDPALREAYLERLWRFVGGLTPAHNSLKAHVLYHRLDLDRSRGVFDRGRFLEYVKLPRSTSYAEPKWLERRENRDNAAHLGADFRAITGLGAPGNDEPLVLDYLGSFFEKAADWKPFDTYIRDDFLKRVFAMTKLVAGEAPAEKWLAFLDPAAAQALHDLVEIDLAATNRTTFRAEDPVSVDVHVKNVPTLVVKVFEVNALNYILATGREPDTSIDLDGLVASETRTHEYKEPPIRRVKRTFTFPSLKKPGVYVVELIGNGKSSRAMIRKGRLRFVERTGPAGHVITILDEANAPLPDATLWLSGRELKPDEKGEITVPFSTQPRTQPIVLRHGALATLERFEHKGESYELRAGIHVERESLVERREAQVAVRAELMVAGTPASVALIEQPSLVVTSTDRHGTSSSKETPFELEDDEESVFTFQVPEDLASLEVTLRGKVQNISRGTKDDVGASRRFEVNGIDATSETEALHLARTEKGYVLSLLGKTGEPRADRPVTFTFAHESYTPERTATLQTDAKGRIVLGALPGIVSVEAESPAGVSETFTLRGDEVRYPAALHGKAGETIAIPYVGSARKVSQEAFSLLERSGDTFVRDQRAKLSLAGGFLEIAGLAAGDYSLVLKESETAIEVRVAPGPVRAGWVAGNVRLLETREAKWLQVVSVAPKGDALEVQLANATEATRVHVVGTRFVPSHSIFDGPGAVVHPGLRGVLPTRSRSDYISGRELGDEYRYVLERKFAKKLPGNMLARPGLLLNPWAMRQTDTTVQQAVGGGVYKSMAPMEPPAAMAPGPRPQPMEGEEGAFASLDFLAEPAAVILNLRPDAKGVVRVSKDALAHVNQVTVLALDTEDAVLRRVALPEVEKAHRDRRLLLGLDPAKHFTEKKQVTCLAAGGKLEVADITTTKLEAYDTLGRVFGLYSTLSKDPVLQQFSFALQWPKLSDAEKGSKLSEFACHELHFFVSRKDPTWFEKVVRPYLANKRAKTFLDRYLLGDDLSEFLRPWAYGRLNVVERILLASRLKGEGPRTARHVSDLLELLPRDTETENRLFRTALQGSALETEDAYGLAAATETVTLDILQSSDAMGSAGAGPGGIPAPMMLAKAASMDAPKKRKREAPKDAEAFDEEVQRESEGARDDASEEKSKAGRRSQLRQRAEQRPFFRKLETTQELGENDYWHRAVEETGPDLVTVNAFWRDFARHERGAFLSPHVARASRNFTEMMFALSVLDLPFGRESEGRSPSRGPGGEAPASRDTPAARYEGARLQLEAKKETVVFHREIKPAQPSAKPVPILVSQNFFRDDDRTREEDGEEVDKYVTDEFLVHVVYVGKVVVTNPTSSNQRLEVLLQIPRGAVPVDSGFKTKGETLELASYATESIEYAFYFPAPGDFLHYPVHVAKDEALVASAPPVVLHVVDRPSRVDKTSWAWVSQHGKTQDVLEFLEKNNVERLDLERIAWRMKDRKVFDQVIALLAARHTWSDVLWAYGVSHGDDGTIREVLLHQDDFLRRCGEVLESPLVTIDPVRRGWYDHREYAPLVNARAHRLGAKRKILNDRFALQYARWMKLLGYKPRLSDDDRLAVAYYFLLQDRVEEALELFTKIDPAKIAARIQYDYLKAYLLFFGDDPRAARAVARPYAEHPVDRWRNLFRNVLAQLDELEGARGEVVDEKDRSQKQGQLAATEAAFELSVENRTVTVQYQNLGSVRVNYYLMDIELLFSRQPFVQQQSAQFAFIKANRSDEVKLPAGGTFSFELPAEFASSNVIVELVAEGVRKAQAYYAHALRLQMVEGYGQLQVARQGGGPLSRVYVKCYARMKGGEVRFFKDGYTDLRGRFDYATLSTDELDGVDRFALLVLSEEHGAVIREAAPPKR
jgi:hypothetical protein